MKKCSVGGQGVLEGVMMRGERISALAVRKADGGIATKTWENKTRNSKIAKLPVVRGVVNFIDMLVVGMRTITDSAKMFDEAAAEEDFTPNRFEKFLAKKTGKDPMDIMMGFAVVIALVLGIGLFFILPTVLTNLFRGIVQSGFLLNLIDGAIRICIFLAYMVLVGLIKDIKRVYMYHGAEHKTIACYEQDQPLTVANVRPCKRLHPRCGTSYLLLVMVLTILIYACIGWNENLFLRFGIRLLLLPLIAGISYEFLKLFAKSDCLIFRILRWPGLQLQRLTTKEPDDDMIEIGILAFEMALEEKSPEELEALKQQFIHKKETELPK